MTIFIVDDSKMIRRRLVARLAEVPGAQIVGQAGVGDEAIASICDLHPDVVLLDLRLGNESGLDVLRAVKRRAPATVVFVLSNFDTPQHRQSSRELGAAGFFDKSREFEELCERLRLLAQSV